MLENNQREGREVQLYTDASGSFGCGTWWDPEWLQLQWPGGLEDWSIAQKELLPVVLACMIQGHQWRGSRIVVYCDNEAVVEMLGAGYSKEPNLMHLLRCVFLVAAFNELSLRPMWMPGSNNKVADAISRNNMVMFWLQAPRARPAPVELPPVWMDLPIHRCPDWTSLAWCQGFKSYVPLA